MGYRRNRPPTVRWYLPADDPAGVHFGYTGTKWGSLIPLLLQMPLFFVLFGVFQEEVLTLLPWMAVLGVAVALAVGLYARRAGWGWYVVDASGRALRRVSRRLDGIPRVLRNRPIVRREEFLQRTSNADK